MIGKKKKYKLGDFDYNLPKKFISQYPEAKRDQSKLMVIHKDSGDIEHKKFVNIIDYMRKNDLLILNNTKVFPARLCATKDRTDAKVEVIFLTSEIANFDFFVGSISGCQDEFWNQRGNKKMVRSTLFWLFTSSFLPEAIT